MDDDIVDAEFTELVDVEATEIPTGEEPDDIVDAEPLDDDGLGGPDDTPGTDLATLDDDDRDRANVTVEDVTTVDHTVPGGLDDPGLSPPADGPTPSVLPEAKEGMPHGSGLKGGTSTGSRRRGPLGRRGGGGGGSGGGGGGLFSFVFHLPGAHVTTQIGGGVRATQLSALNFEVPNSSGRRPSGGRRR